MAQPDDQVYPVPGEPGAFSTSLVLREGASAMSSVLECMVAKRVAPGEWQVKKRSCSMSPNGSLQVHPPKEKPVTVDGATAYEMLRAHEAAQDVPDDRKGRTFEWAQYYPKMAEIARQARLETAKQAGGVSKHVALNRRRKPKAP